MAFRFHPFPLVGDTPVGVDDDGGADHADRDAAIAEAMHRAQAGDVVLLAGKGHERTIETSAGEIAWDEAAVARAALRSRPG